MRRSFWIFSTIVFALIALCSNSDLHAQRYTFKSLAYGNMDNWQVREIEESGVIGGKTKYLYEITRGDTLRNNTPYRRGRSPWATSSVMAKVSGIYKGSVTVFPERRNNGFAAKLETRIEQVKVLGIINISVLASGTVFLGEVLEPIRDTKNPMSKLMIGQAFTERPKVIAFDYKYKQGNNGGKRIKMTGFSKVETISGVNGAEVYVLLQNRRESADGKIYAKRVACGWQRFSTNTLDWVNNYILKIYYGDASKEPWFKPHMGLFSGAQTQYCKNSKGVVVPIIEDGWGSTDDSVTHIVLSFSSSYEGPYVGAPGSTFWIDNVKLGY